MPRYAVNLGWLFTEYPFFQRFAHVARGGFRAVEIPFPYAWPVDEIAAHAMASELDVILINTPAGDVDRGEAGRLSDPGQRDAFRRDLERGLEYANRLGCRQLHTMVGKALPGVDPAAQRACMLENLAAALPAARDAGVTLLIEAINPIDIEGYFLTRSSAALSIIAELNSDQVAFEYDVYHMQRVEGNLIETLQQNITRIGHIQIADAPGRHEPGTGEINVGNVLRAIDAAGYGGYVGLEYRPSGRTEESFSWLRAEGAAVAAQ